MSQLFSIYCDESCHLESQTITSENSFMVLGGIMCPQSHKEEITTRIKEIKLENSIGQNAEMKWTKVSTTKLNAYKDLINYFFDINELKFRAVVVDKIKLTHGAFNQSHDEFYYKIYWLMLDFFISQSNKYHIYLDIKDTQGADKTRKLHEVIANSNYDFNHAIIQKIQQVRSHEIAMMQLVDILIGAISYANRYGDAGKSASKNELVRLIKKRSGISLIRTTPLGERKFNVFCWEGRR